MIGLLLIMTIMMPATARMNVTTLDNGTRTYSNGTYWITWSPIGNHTVGDKFFINATTNLPAGTVFGYGYFSANFPCHQKVCNDTGWAIWDYTIIVAGDHPKSNYMSIWIDTTGLHGDDMYFMFGPIMSTLPPEYRAFYEDFIITGSLLTLPVTPGPSPTRSPVPFILTPGALFGAAWIVIVRRKRGIAP